MWIPCLSLIKNNFGKRPINTFPAKREMREKKEAVEEEEEEEWQAERKRKKREKFDDISKSVSVCAMGQPFPWPRTVALTLLLTALMF